MVKKNWSNPEVLGLGLENTKEECTTKDDKGNYVHICNYCGKVFLSHKEEIKHQKDCYKNPIHKPVNPLPGENEGTPMS